MGTLDYDPNTDTTTNMKIIILAAFVALAAARPQFDDELAPPVAIIREEADPIDGANFRHEFEADNGIAQSMSGSADENGAQVMQGSYSFPLPDGTMPPSTGLLMPTVSVLNLPSSPLPLNQNTLSQPMLRNRLISPTHSEQQVLFGMKPLEHGSKLSFEPTLL